MKGYTNYYILTFGIAFAFLLGCKSNTVLLFFWEKQYGIAVLLFFWDATRFLK